MKWRNKEIFKCMTDAHYVQISERAGPQTLYDVSPNSCLPGVGYFIILNILLMTNPKLDVVYMDN